MPRTKGAESIAKQLLATVETYLYKYIYSTNLADVTEAENNLVEVYSIDQKLNRVENCKKGFLPEYMDGGLCSDEECIAVIDEAILQSFGKLPGNKKERNNRIELILRNKEITQGQKAGQIERILNRNIDYMLKRFYADKYHCTKYQTKQLRKIRKAGLNLYKNSVEELGNALGDFKDSGEKGLLKTEHVVYKLRRLFSDDYPYLREYVEIKYPDQDQAVICKKVKDQFGYSENGNEKRIKREEPVVKQFFAEQTVDSSDTIVFDKYFCSRRNQEKSNLAKAERIKSIDRRITKIQKIIDSIVGEEAER